ncbi:MAG: hypothetical protein N3A61_08950, partial [Ignavibacteria bacterium]|nr:hypothetical protein [Ignavibacteria bacterium]
MIKFKPATKITLKEKQCYLFFTFTDTDEVKNRFKEVEELLNQKIHSAVKENFINNSETQFIYYFGSGSCLLIQKVGKKDKLNPDTFRRASASAIKKLNSLHIKNLTVIVPALNQNQIEINFKTKDYYIQSIIEGIELGCYKFDQYLSKKNNINLSIELFYPELKSEKINTIIKTSQLILKWVKQARDLQNIPGCDLYPEVLANKVKSLAKQMKSVKVKVFDHNQILKMKMGGLNAVGKGSEHPPRFIVLEYWGKDKSSQPYVILGKGITFDSGGISLKPAASMWEMKGDMSGAASALSSIFAAAELKLKINLVGLIPTAENMPCLLYTS